jgi:hypothetical protein
VIATSVQCVVREKAALWLIMCMYERHATLFSSAPGVWPCYCQMFRLLILRQQFSYWTLSPKICLHVESMKMPRSS